MSRELSPLIHENALKILQKRYLWPKDGGQETPKEMFWRVAHKVASAEAVFGNADLCEVFEQVFMEMMCDLRFVPNTPTLTNAGREKGQLAACYVLPIGDSMESIMDCLKAQAMVQKSGGGTGFNYGYIRERDAYIKSTGMRAVGPIPVIKLKNFMMTEFIIQGGTRHGANMGVLPVDHPDIEEFITFKKVDGSCKSFNVSPAVPDAFMQAVKDDTDWDLISRVDKSVKKTIKARSLFDLIATSAHETGDPGMLFIDTANKTNPTPNVGRLEATNPCGEQWLLSNEACTLGHLNLSKYYIKNPESNGSWQTHFNWPRFADDIRNAVRFLDNVIEVNYYALPEIQKMHKDTNRKIGLGVMGEADLLIQLGTAYGSQEARDVCEEIAKFFREHADHASSNLGKERGSFGAFLGSAVEVDGWEAMRNACRTTVAPTGTTAIIANCSTSIEPVFAFILKRDQAGIVMYEMHPMLSAHLQNQPPEVVKGTIAYYFEHNSFKGCPFMDEALQNVFVQANDVSVEDHIQMQAVWQKYIDNSISKTINMANSATVADVKKAYMMAWELGCKGVTIYRDGCRANQALNIAGAKEVSPGLFVADKSTSIFAPVEPKVEHPCPECKEPLDIGGGCETCKSCGYAACHI